MKLARLYEFYMQSLDEETVKELPSAVLYYFNYNNQLDWKRKAFLYRYIIRRRQSQERIYYSYENIIKAFTYEQLSLGHIDANLAELYKFYITRDKMNSKLARELPGCYVQISDSVHPSGNHQRGGYDAGSGPGICLSGGEW